MRVKLENPTILSKAIELICELVLEVRIKVSEFGMSISAMDQANVAMVGFKIPKSAFVEFEAEDDVLGVNLDDLKKILKRCSSSGSIILKKEENMLKIEIFDRIKRDFSLNLIEVDSEDIDFETKISRMEFVCKVGVKSQDLVDCIEDCLVVGDSCTFEIKEGKLIIGAKGMNSTKAEFSSDEAEIEGENSRAKYSLEYLTKFVKGSKLCEKTYLNFSNDHPLKLDIKPEHFELSFVLAPRIETED